MAMASNDAHEESRHVEATENWSSRLPASRWVRNSRYSENSIMPTSKRPFYVLAICQLLLVLTLLALSSAGYVVISRNIQTARRSGSQTNSIITSPAFVTALFVVLCLILCFALWRIIVRLVRLSIYPLVSDPATSGEIADETGQETSPVRTLLFGKPPPRLAPPCLPTYDSALRQGARQEARRTATALGLSAGRRGREQYGTGDTEDLEVQRIKKLGGLPPLYRSSEMRKSTVLLKGAKPERRSSIRSFFSNTTNDSNSPTTLTSGGRLSNLLRKISHRLSLGSVASVPARSTPSPELEANEDKVMTIKEEEDGNLEMAYLSRDGTAHSLHQSPTRAKSSYQKKSMKINKQEEYANSFPNTSSEDESVANFRRTEIVV